MSSIKIRSIHQDGKIQLRILITHPMETGRNRDKNTNLLIPAHFIQTLTLTLNDKTLINGQIGTGISKDPYFSFNLKNGKAGDKISVAWTDNLGNQDFQEHIIQNVF